MGPTLRAIYLYSSFSLSVRSFNAVISLRRVSFCFRAPSIHSYIYDALCEEDVYQIFYIRATTGWPRKNSGPLGIFCQLVLLYI